MGRINELTNPNLQVAVSDRGSIPYPACGVSSLAGDSGAAIDITRPGYPRRHSRCHLGASAADSGASALTRPAGFGPPVRAPGTMRLKEAAN